MQSEQPRPNKKKSLSDIVGRLYERGQNVYYKVARLDKNEQKVILKQHDLTDCGAACLASIAAHYGLRMPIARIRQMASTDQKGTNITGISEAAGKLGMSSKALKGDFDMIYELPKPAICHVVIGGKLNHYVVVYDADKEKGIKVMDPGKGTMEWQTTEEFGKIWTNIAIILAPVEEFVAGDNTVPVMQRFAYLLQPHKKMLVQVMLGAVVYTLLGFAMSIYLRKIIDNVLPEGNRRLLNIMGIIMIGLMLVQIFINRVRTILTIKTGQQIDARLILGYYKHLLRLPQSFFDTMRVGEVISRMNDAVKIRTFINEVLVSFAVNVFILIFSFALMFTAYWKLAMCLLLILPLYGVIFWYSNKVHRRTQRKMMEESADLQAQLVESVTAVGTIKRFGLEDFANVKTENRFIKLLGTVYKSSTNSLTVSNSSSMVSGLFAIVLLWAGASFVLNAQLSPGELLSFYAIVGYFTGPVLSLIGMNKTAQDALIAADRLFEIIDLERESHENKTALKEEMIGDINFHDVHFRYGTRVEVFKGLNMTIPVGKITAVVGESGSGKTTLLSLLQYIYPIESGNITIGDLDIRYIKPDSLRRVVGVVPQQVDLFNGTVMENIAVGDPEPDMLKVINICRNLGILEFIEALPSGFNNHLGENGASLSGGQRQRLSIARALYRDPKILIMDEATSALDSASEAHIQQAISDLREEGKTIILIAHRLSTVVNADKIIVMQKGEIIEEGPHDELLHAQGAYYNMWELQFPMIKELMVPRRARRKPVAKEDDSARNDVKQNAA